MESASLSHKEDLKMFHHVSRPFTMRTSLGIALLSGVGLAALGAAHPAVASSIIAAANSLVTCATSTACVAGTNTSNGAGVSGTSTNGFGVSAASTNALGIYATSTNSNGIFAYSANSSGVNGSSAKAFGVIGSSGGTSSNAAGVYGDGFYKGVVGQATSTNTGWGVIGYTIGGTGTAGQANGGGIGVSGGSESGVGVWAASGSGTGLNATSSAGIAVRAHKYGSGFSVVGTSDDGLGAGADFEGGRFGIVGRAYPNGFPLVLTNNTGKNVFYVDGIGNVHTTGNFQPLVRTASGATITSYTAKSTQPTVEDTGTAQLIAGVAMVALDPTFAATVDQSTPYRVFITPDGDTRGLFVAAKTPRGFIVHETQGGRSNLVFDYRIVASGQGQAGVRMAVTRAGVEPNAPIAPPAAQREPNVPAPPKP